ncbi:hypothetical protein ABPG75_012331 [Micractinium tetrahymenae]
MHSSRARGDPPPAADALVAQLRRRVSRGEMSAACSALNSISARCHSAPQACREILAAGGAIAVAQFIATGRRHASVSSQALTRAIITFNVFVQQCGEAGQREAAASGAIHELAQVLLSAGTEGQWLVRTAAAEALTWLTFFNEQCSRAAVSAIPGLLQLLEPGEHAMAAEPGINTLNNIIVCGGVEARDAFAAHSGMAALVRLLGRERAPVGMLQTACYIAGKLAEGSADHAEALAASGCIPPLVRLLSHASLAVAGRALYALRSMSFRLPQYCESIAAAGAVPPLLPLLRQTQHQEAAEEAALLLRNLVAGSDRACRDAVQSNAVPDLQRLACRGGASTQVQSYAAQTLRSIDHWQQQWTAVDRCSVRCQHVAWLAHKHECRRLQAEAAAAAAAADTAASEQDVV